jgi:DNA-binding SARP family transcriptional activator
VRQDLLSLAEGIDQVSANLSIRASLALLALDPYDESAMLAMSRQLDVSGRRVAAREVLIGFAKKLEEDLDEKPSDAIALVLAKMGGGRA